MGNRDKRKSIFTETMRDQRPDGKGGFVHKDSEQAYSYSSQMASQDTHYTGSSRPAVQSNAPVFKAYLKGGGDWGGRGQAAVDSALAAAYKEVQRRKRPADDACEMVERQEAVVITSYTELVQQYVGDLERSSSLERNVASVISTLERSVSRSWDELIKRDRVRLERRSDHDANEVFYEWLQTQKSGIDPDDWAKKRRAYIDEQKKLGGAATTERKSAEKELVDVERKLKDSMKSRVKHEVELFNIEKQLKDSRTGDSLKKTLQQKAESLRDALAKILNALKALVQRAITAKQHQVHGVVREVHVRNADRLKSKDFDLAGPSN